MSEKMSIPCVGGMLDGITIHKENPEEVIHQSGMFTIRIHQAYPKRKGEKILNRLHTYWEEYDLTMTEDGPIYRCRAPWDGKVWAGGEELERIEGGGFVAYADAAGKLRARR